MHVRSIFVGLAIVLAFGSAIVLADVRPNTTVNVELQTSQGKIVLQLDGTRAPKSVANFLKYVDSGHYNDTVFHRVIDGFMIQGGGMDRDLREKETLPPIKNEASNGLKNEKYTVAMARSGDPDSATSQFFINIADNDFLNREQSQDGYGYAVFGKVVAGHQVIDKIAKSPTQVQPNPLFPAMLMEDVPVTPIMLKSSPRRERRREVTDAAIAPA